MPNERFCENEHHLEPFRVENAEPDHTFSCTWADALPEPSGELVASTPAFRVYQDSNRQTRYLGFCEKGWEYASTCIIHQGDCHDVMVKADVYPGKLSSKLLLEAMAAEHLIARNDGFIFHCSYIDRGGKAILFTAPSETGKSTQADLWARHRGAEIINGDRAAVRLVDGVLMAEGIPFAGSSKFCKNRSLPIEAVVYLSQAPVTTIRKLRGYEAFSKIWEGVSVNTWDKEDLERVSSVVKTLVETVPVYHMPCTPDEAAVLALENVLIP